MDSIINELGIKGKNVLSTASPGLFTVVVHNNWIKKLLKNCEVDNSVNTVDFLVQYGESVPHPWRKIYIKVLCKKMSKVLPLPKYKLHEGTDTPLTFSQLLQYVSQNNQRNLWKESYKKHCPNIESTKETAIVNLLEHDQLLTEVLLRLYGCNIIRIKYDSSGNFIEYKETIPNKYVSKSYETHVNLLAAMFILETDNNYYVVYRGHYDNNLLDCLNFSPNLIDMNYTNGLFLIYQLLNACKALSDRGLSMGPLTLQDVYLTDNLWLQILPTITNNVHTLDASLVYEQNKSKQSTPAFHNIQVPEKKEEWCNRDDAAQLEKLCMLWVRGRISNLDYLLHLNVLAGRSANDPQTHFMVPWVTDFSSRCGKNWRDLSKSKYRLNKGDRQLDMTYDAANLPDQIPHHVTDPLSDITCYVYLARRTSKEILCKHVRNKWVPAEYPASIQRLQEWTPDECIPEFYTDPTVFKSIHEDLPDLGIPSWATCVEDFITKHREALESTYVSDNLHHWIDITFGYKLSGAASVKAKNVCLSLVDGHTSVRRGVAVQLLNAPHPPRQTRLLPPAPPRLHWTAPRDKKGTKQNDSSDDVSEEDEESSSLPQHVSRLNVPAQRVRKHKSSSRARSLSKSQDDSTASSESRASSHSRHYRVPRSELGKGIIFLPKEFNPVAPIQALEALDNFRTKCFFSTAQNNGGSEVVRTTNFYPMQQESSSAAKETDDTAFTNHMFQASYDVKYLKKFTHNGHLENVLKERKNRSFNNRYATDATVYKQFVVQSRRQDMLVIGCLIVEIFLHAYMRPLRTNNGSFIDRYNTCRTVLKYNFNSLPKCVSYVASLLLDIQAPSPNFRNELAPFMAGIKKEVVTDKGLPLPTPAQLLNPILMQHLIPFPQSFNMLYKLLSALHEYELTSNELNILYTYQCDGTHCDKYKNVDKIKLDFSQKIAEGKIQACITHLDLILKEIDCFHQFKVLDIFLIHYIELLKSKDTSVLAAWYLFDTVSKALGPAETRNKLLKHIVNLYEDEETDTDKVENKSEGNASAVPNGVTSKQKFVKLYHHIFLLQLMVRLGLQCFLDNFTQHLVEAVGGYKDLNVEIDSPGHQCHSRTMAYKKPRYSDDNVKNALSSATDIFSPDTSYGSEQIVTPNVEKKEVDLKGDGDRSENELFHFENDKERFPSPSRSKSPVESLDSYTMAAQDSILSPSPGDVFSPNASKDFSPNISRTSKELNVVVTKVESEEETGTVASPSMDIPARTMFTSYLHFAEDDSRTEDAEARTESRSLHTRSWELNRNISQGQNIAHNLNEDEGNESKEAESCKISDVSVESLIWLAHRLGPVLTCRYITRNLLKMLTLCYIGKDNLAPSDGDEKDEFDGISIANSRVVGDRNAVKVIKCLTAIVAMYGEQLIIFQYLPHMGELIASCRRRLSVPLEGGAVACIHLLKYLLPYMSDATVMEQLQDTFLKCIVQPTLRLASTLRCAYPSGTRARRALARKLLDALHALSLRVGREMTRRHLCVPALQRFFLTFDKANGKLDNWPKQEESTITDKDMEPDCAESKCEGFVEICRDGSTAEWRVQDGRVVRADLPDLACTPPDPPDHAPDTTQRTAQDELLMVFDEELAYQAYTTFTKFVGEDTMERSLKNIDTIRTLCRKYEENDDTPGSTNCSKVVQPSFSDEPISKRTIDITPTKSEAVVDHISSSNSFGTNVTLVGNRIDVVTNINEESTSTPEHVVAYNMDNGVRSNRHLRGDWLIYWEHEIGRPDKGSRFNLKQIKLQTFAGHSHSVKSIYCLDNEHSFMSGSKDKTVKLWSLRNQGDGKAITQCNWTYTGHKKGVLSLTFLESQRLAVSTDSVVHIWDPFMESAVSQLEHMKSSVSIVRALPGPSPVILAATTDATLRLIDARACNHTHELKVPHAASTFIRCVCVCPSGAWSACGLASGHVLVFDARTGQPRAHWRAHDGEVLRVAAVDDRRVLSSGLDQLTALWSADDGELLAHLKGNTEPVHCLSVYYNELISGTTNNRIGVHTSLEQDASFSSTKLRSDALKGVLTCMSVLPLNRLLLLGSDNGTINLLC